MLHQQVASERITSSVLPAAGSRSSTAVKTGLTLRAAARVSEDPRYARACAVLGVVGGGR